MNGAGAGASRAIVEPRGRSSLSPSWLLTGFVVLAVSLALGLLAVSPPRARPADAPAQLFSAERALPLLQRLLDDIGPHPVGSEANALLRSRIVGEFTSLGYPVEEQTALACHTGFRTCGQVVNLMTRLPGLVDGPAVMLTAHYDSVAAGPGAADDMAGVAALLEVARILRSDAPLRNPVIFLLTDGEEAGLLGAEAFAGSHPWANEVGVVVNLEARGSSGPSMLFETSVDNAWLIDAFAAAAERPVTSSVFYEIYKILPADTDLSVYLADGMAGVNFAFIGGSFDYHTANDSLERLSAASLQHHGDNALAATRAFAGLDLDDPPRGDAVFTSLGSGVVLRWPASLAPWLALACLMVWILIAFALLRHREFGAGALLLGVLATLLGLVVAAALGWVAIEALLRNSPVSQPWHAYPLPTRVAVWGSGLLAVSLLALLLARLGGFWLSATSTWLLWSLLLCAVAWSGPGPSVLFMIPAGLAALLLGGVALTPLRGSAAARGLATLSLVLVAGYLWLPLALALEDSLGLGLAPALALLVAMPSTTLMPLFSQPRGQGAAGRWLSLGTASLAAVALFTATLLPPFSEARPQRLNLVHHQGPATPTAQLLLDSGWSTPLEEVLWNEGIVEAAGFEPAALGRLPWSSRDYPAVSVPATGEPPPTIEVLEDQVLGDARRILLQLGSPRGAERLTLLVPADARLQSMVVMGLGADLAEHGPLGGAYKLDCYGSTCSGLVLELTLPRTQPLSMVLFDQSSGLPEALRALADARSRTATPSQDGDVTLLSIEIDLPPP